MKRENEADASAYVLPERIRRELQKGETIWHSLAACHVSKKFPTGKWLGVVRRDESGRLVKYPVKGFGTPQEALAYVKTLRPNANGRVASKRQGEPSVADLYDYVRLHSWKRLSERRKAGKESRWRLHIEPYWGTWALSQVTRKAAQTWITETEDRIKQSKVVSKGLKGHKHTLGLPGFQEVRTDLSQMFAMAADFDEAYGERRNPFANLSFEEVTKRAKVTLESHHFNPLLDVCFRLVEVQLATPWIVEMFATSLLGGLREGEVMALMANRIDWKHKMITVDRAFRLDAQDIDDETGLPTGPIIRMALGLPKNDKTRVVPMSDQLATILKPLCDGADLNSARPYLWPNKFGSMKEPNRFQKSWQTLRKRLDLLAKLSDDRWSKFNAIVAELRDDEALRLPDVFHRMDYRDTRNTFASYANEAGVSQATREAILGHLKGVTNLSYTDMTRRALDDAQERLSNGWQWQRLTSHSDAA